VTPRLETPLYQNPQVTPRLDTTAERDAIANMRFDFSPSKTGESGPNEDAAGTIDSAGVNNVGVDGAAAGVETSGLVGCGEAEDELSMSTNLLKELALLKELSNVRGY
jgi:hypothetical protein